ncbi:hypothetical protein [Sphingomonas sp. Leaf22]|uniref:hypothetical protein n=1 Tax=Sphingomonas sp. Leaf22 TaxID=1735687 RepID=UPI0012E24442|nr:hypothetical protein [Sphingomonas sp. Leaf22]
MIKRNDQGREIWFDRVAWSYTPNHWKGIVYPIPMIFITVALCWWVAGTFNEVITVATFLVSLAAMMWFCERHSPARH